jgi:hypothetical protein
MLGRKFTVVFGVGIRLSVKQGKYGHKPTVYQVLKLIAEN